MNRKSWTKFSTDLGIYGHLENTVKYFSNFFDGFSIWFCLQNWTFFFRFFPNFPFYGKTIEDVEHVSEFSMGIIQNHRSMNGEKSWKYFLESQIFFRFSEWLRAEKKTFFNNKINDLKLKQRIEKLRMVC